MTTEEFDRHKEALKAQKLEKPKRLSSQYSHYINEIALQQYHFDRNEKEVEILMTITKDQVLEYYKVSSIDVLYRRSRLKMHDCSYSSRPTRAQGNRYRFTFSLIPRTLKRRRRQRRKKQSHRCQW
jgi:secreted Zn-dependent insulinase-like peptidase